MKDDGSRRPFVFVQVVKGKDLPAFWELAVYDGTIGEHRFGDDPLVAVIVDDVDGLFVKLSYLATAFDPVLIGSFVHNMPGNDKTESMTHII
jgi:hypothetical protein